MMACLAGCLALVTRATWVWSAQTHTFVCLRGGAGVESIQVVQSGYEGKGDCMVVFVQGTRLRADQCASACTIISSQALWAPMGRCNSLVARCRIPSPAGNMYVEAAVCPHCAAQDRPCSLLVLP